MGRKKLLKRLTEFFDMNARDRNQKKEELNDLLSRLKLKETELKTALENESDEEQKISIAQKIDVVHSQRKKGVIMLKELHADSTPQTDAE